MSLRLSPFMLLLLFGLFLISIPIAFAQENGTPTPVSPTQQVTTSPQPNLQYLPQKAYIVPVGPNGEVAAVPYQDGGSSTAEATGIVGILTAIGTGLWAKMSAKKDVKQTNSALL